MSEKRSVTSKQSTAVTGSTAGLTTSSKTVRSGAVPASTTHRPPTTPSAPQTPMTNLERQQSIRCSITRLKYSMERYRHFSKNVGDIPVTGTPSSNVEIFFTKLAKHVSKLEYSPKKKGDPDSEPTYLDWLRGEVRTLVAAAKEVSAEMSAALSEGNSSASTGVYAGMLHGLLVEISSELANLATLLVKDKLLPSRMNMDLLNDQVAFHVDEFDSFFEERAHAFLSELRNEGALYSEPVYDATRTADPIGMVSVVVLDLAIGLRPVKAAHVALNHLQNKISEVDKRVSSSEAAIKAMPIPVTPEEQRLVDMQKREHTIIRESVQHAQSFFDRSRQKWQADEADILEKAQSGSHDLKTLLESKKMKEHQLISDIQVEHTRLVHACLPFLSPQFHRRKQLTYSTPCQIRLGVRFFNAATKAFVNIFTLSPDFFPMMIRNNVNSVDYEALSYLFPSKDQMWLPFGDFPEMVRGARCAIRGTHHLLDHRRALEEQKECGGYFLMRGGERILRALLMQRCNVPINIYRERFTTQGPNFAAKAVVFRSKRPSGITAQNYFYYSTVGDIIFSFARKVVWHIPVLLLLNSLKPGTTPVAIFQLMTVGLAASSPLHNARVEAMLQHHRNKPYGDLEHFLDYLSVLGRMYRQYHQSSMTFRFLPELAAGLQCQHDAWYGLFMLRRHVLPHLNCSAATPDLSPFASPEEVSNWPGQHILAEMEKKFQAVVMTCRQLFDFFDGKSEHQGNDVPAYQEVFTVSQVLVGAWEVCLNTFMKRMKYTLADKLSAKLFRAICDLPQASRDTATDIYRQLRGHLDHCGKRGGEPLAPLYRLLVTGNFALDREEDFYCPQTSGWVVMAEHLNFFRFFEQLRCLHRGKTIADMRSSEVRRFPCEAYGFICMVHSPDGEDCGVLNHMSLSTIVSSSVKSGTAQAKELGKWIRRAIPSLIPNSASLLDRFIDTVPVWVEGCVVGYVKASQAQQAVTALRENKAIYDGKLLDLNGVVRRDFVSEMNTLEIVLVPPRSKDPAGLYIFGEHGRLMRPVQQIEPSKSRNSSSNNISFPLVFVGTWEQTWLNIASVPSDLADAFEQLNRKYDFMEQQGSNIISLTSATIPFFEHNCSPRNLFQCGLSKQSAGTQMQAVAWRREAKLFRMYTPQKYISRTLPMDYLGLDDVSLGVNATIAVLCYTGYDLDDAIIVNHTATERGMLNAGVTIAKVVTAHVGGSQQPTKKKSQHTKPDEKDEDSGVDVFQNMLASGSRHCGELDERGLPLKRLPASLVNFQRDHKFPPLQPISPVYCCARRYTRLDELTNKPVYHYSQHHVTRWRHFDKGEAAWIHSVIPLEFNGPDPTSVLIVFRIPRNPCIGDKFSSRHGQKGTLPLHISALDLPFTSTSGITPDVIINPHAFPSRMTVGMVFEIMAAKLGAIDGRFMDNSAWSTVDEGPRVAESLGEALVRAGYNRSGREALICGISGEEMEADVFFGISGYQRLRHMVNDKWQSRARTDSHVHRAVTKTGQPVKGRKRHGGVRVGEMERDGLLSHGIAEVVVDRLLHVSDKTIAFICTDCGSLLSIYERAVTRFMSWKSCKFCGAGSDEGSDQAIQMVHIPQVLRLWVAELASIGVRVTLNVK